MKKWKWFVGGLMAGLTTLSLGIASVPKQGMVIGTGLSEIRVAKELEPSFDSDVARLAQLESRYQERLPELRNVRRGKSRLGAPMKRVTQQKYSYSGKRAK